LADGAAGAPLLGGLAKIRIGRGYVQVDKVVKLIVGAVLHAEAIAEVAFGGVVLGQVQPGGAFLLVKVYQKGGIALEVA